MASEEDIIKFLMKHNGEATLDEIASSLKIQKYGLNSAYALLYSLKSKNIVERRGDKWVLIKREPSHLVSQKPVEEVVREIAKNLREISPESSNASLKIEVEKRETPAELAFIKPDETHEAIRALRALRTGTILDSLFLRLDGEPLGGIPLSAQIMLIGPMGAGKSLIVNEAALKIADSGKKVLYIAPNDDWSTGLQRFDLQSRMRIRAENLNLSWRRICENLYVFDQQLMKKEFLEKYRQLVADKKIAFSIFDSLNALKPYMDEAGNFHKILEDLIQINRIHDVTSLFTAHLNPEKFGLIAAPETNGFSTYLMDGVVAVTNVRINAQGLNINIKGAESLRVIKVLWCRLCGFVESGILIHITYNGLIQPFEDALISY